MLNRTGNNGSNGSSNGTACPPVADMEPVPDNTPTGIAFPIMRANPAAGMARREVMFGAGGFVLGVGLTLAILHFCSRRMR